MVNGHVVLAGFHAGKQVRVIGGDKRGAHLHFLGQQFTQLHFKAGEFVALFEIVRRSIGFQGDAQFTAIVDVVNQFGMSQGAQKRKQQQQARRKAHGHS